MVYKCCIVNCRPNCTVEESKTAFSSPKGENLKKKWIKVINRKGCEPISLSYICIRHFEEKYYKKGENSNRYGLAINMKPVPTTCDPKTVINKYSEMLPHQSVFLRDHRRNVYIKMASVNHLSPRTQLKTLFTCLDKSLLPSGYTFTKKLRN